MACRCASVNVPASMAGKDSGSGTWTVRRWLAKKIPPLDTISTAAITDSSGSDFAT